MKFDKSILHNAEEKVKDNIKVCNKIYTNKIENLSLDMKPESYTIDQSKTYEDCEFIGIDFTGITFALFKFERVTFKECSLGGTTFLQCMFYDTDFINCKTDGAMRLYGNIPAKNLYPLLFAQCTISNCTFNESSIQLRIKHSLISSCVYYNCNLSFSTFEDSKMELTKIHSCNIPNVKFQCEFLLNDFVDLKVNEETEFIALNEYTKDWSRTSALYSTVYPLFRMNGLSDVASKYYLKYRKFEVKNNKGLKKIKAMLLYSFMGYGEKPINVLISALFVIIIFSFIYLISGVEVNDELIKYSVPLTFDFSNEGIKTLYISLNKCLNDLWRCIYFSIVTFTTLGYGDVLPENDLTKLFVSIEVILGVIISSVGTASIYKKITKS